jgi:4-amino-4-deoxy-L-arabinose transferase-like glycosyltransferase
MFAKANGLSQRFMAIFIPRLALIASKFAGGIGEWTVRLPAALGGIGFVSATYFTGRESLSQKVGLIAGVVLATSVRVICEAR